MDLSLSFFVNVWPIAKITATNLLNPVINIQPVCNMSVVRRQMRSRYEINELYKSLERQIIYQGVR